MRLKNLIYIGLIFLVILLWESIKKWSPWSVFTQTTHNQVLTEISKLGKLELVKYSFKDIVEQEIVQQLLPNPKALLIIEGEAVGCVDLQKISEKDIEMNKDTLVVFLPEPELCYYKIDHSKSKVYDTSFAFMNEGLLLEEAFKKAEEQIKQGAITKNILGQTKRNAQGILGPILEKISNKKVLVKFRN